jgi:hypothetical protein
MSLAERPDRSPRYTRYWHHALALGLYAALSLLFTWPLVTHLTTHVAGSATWAFDEYTFLWNPWWFRYALLVLRANPLYSDYIFYPVGISLVLYTFNLLNAALSLPLQFFCGLPLIVNTLNLFSLTVSGYGTYLLVLYLFSGRGPGARGAALVAGALYAFTASRIVYLALGHYNFANSHWIPFFVLCFVRLVDRPDLRDGALAGVFLALTTLTEMTLGTFLILFALLYLAVAVASRTPDFRSLADFARACGAGTSRSLRLLRALGVLAGVGLLLSAPFLYFVLWETLSGDYTLVGWGGALQLSADLMGFLTPPTLHPWWGGDWVSELRRVTEGTSRFSDINTAFIGYGLLIAGLFGLSVERRRARVWAWVALFFALLSLGPVLQINGKYTFDLDGLSVTLPMPFIVLHYLPILKANRVPNRFIIMTILALAVLAGYALQWLLCRIHLRLRHRWKLNNALRTALPTLLGALLLVEHVSFPLPLTDARVPEIYYRLAREPGDFAVLQFPLGWRNSFRVEGAERTQAQYYQTVHHKRLLGGNTSRNPAFKFDYFQRIPFIHRLTDIELYRQGETDETERDRALAAQAAYLYDLRYLVILPPIPGRYPYADTMTATVAYAMKILPLEETPFYEKDGVTAYCIIQPPPQNGFQVDMGVAGSEMYRGEGWGDNEEIGGVTANWATEREALLFIPLRQVRSYRLTIRASPFTYAGSPSQTMEAALNGQALGKWDLTPGWASYAADVPAEAIRYGPNRLTLRFSHLARPRDVLPVQRAIGNTGVEAPVDIEVNSAGAAAGSFAYILIASADGSVHKRGYNLAVIEPATGRIARRGGFDTAGSAEEAQKMARFIQEIPGGYIVAVAVQEDGATNLTAEGVAALREIGAQVDLRGRLGHSHAIIGVKGAPPGTALEATGEGNAYLRVGSNPDTRTLATAVDSVLVN